MPIFQKILTGVIVGALLLGGGVVWYFFSSAPAQEEAQSTGTFGTGGTRTDTTNAPSAPAQSPQPQTTESSKQKIFRIATGPVAGATFIQTQNPTTTLVRFMRADNGHVQELVLDSPGAIPRAVSNTTIPGVIGAQWADGGESAVVQYLDGGVVKTAYLGFPPSTATSSLNRAVDLRFLPDGITDLVVSPDGERLVYLLSASSGTAGYTASVNGTGVATLFTLPLSEILIEWSAPNTLLAYTKSAAGAPGAAFSINAQSGAVTPLLFAQGLTATAGEEFSHVVYQTVSATRASYTRDIEEGRDVPLSFDPTPEKCIWGKNIPTALYCALPISYVAPNYLDQLHRGTALAADTIVGFNSITGKSILIATPGGESGGSTGAIAELDISPDGKYLLFVTQNDRSLWGVRLGAGQ